MKKYKIGKTLIGKGCESIDNLIIEAETKERAIQIWQFNNQPIGHLWALSVKELLSAKI